MTSQKSNRKIASILIIFSLVALAVGVKRFTATHTDANAPVQGELPEKKSEIQTSTSHAPETVSASATPVEMKQFSAPTQQKLAILREIFKTKNDNDPRMDTELKNLSDEMKVALMQEYQATQPEKRNELGTVVFLLGREIKSPGDLAFFKKVMDEAPCLSMSDCSKVDPPASGEEAHLESLNQTTLNYPQIMALRMQEEAFEKASQNQSLRESILAMVQEASTSSNARIAREAREILTRIRK